MFVPRRYWPPVALIAVAFLGFFIIVVLDIESSLAGKAGSFVPLRADARIICTVNIMIGVLWLMVLRGREYAEARLGAKLVRMDRVIREAMVDALANADTKPIPRLHVVRGTAAVASPPLATIDPSTVHLLRRLDNELRRDDQQ